MINEKTTDTKSEFAVGGATFSFMGLGLIGGSIAKGARTVAPDLTIKALEPDSASLQPAMEEGVVNQGFTEPEDAFFDCDVLFLCAPVSVNEKFLRENADRIQEKTLITDVGSVKSTTVKTVRECGLSSRFIGGHPMAGSEKTGFKSANAQLLENAYYLLTPTEDFPEDKTHTFSAFIERIGAIPLIMTPQKHDQITGGISHLPHVISASLVNFVKEHDEEDGLMKLVAAGGFKDITRISSSSPAMWQSICMTNTPVIENMLADYISSLSAFQDVLKQRDPEKLYDFFSRAKDYRDSFQAADRGPIKKISDLYVDIPDVPGSIAQTSTILALHGLSIKNIGIMNSREFQEGALRIEFYDDSSVEKAAALLKDHGYKIFR
ncbi:MAG: prephenate dehydrogenase [Lachnospiraceae bacterium]|nr:prephenate dehydrogenase [Lachnospiraceae bacterium]